MRILGVLGCIALLVLSACESKPKKPLSGTAFIDEFHTLCPHEMRSAEDATKAFIAAGAEEKRPIIGAFVQAHDPAPNMPAFTRLERGNVQWWYDNDYAANIFTASETRLPDGGMEIRCKVQVPTGQGEFFDFLVQYASGSLPVNVAFADGARMLLYKDQHAAKGVSAYYVLWRGLPEAVWRAKPSLALIYVVRTGPPLPDPVTFLSPATTAVARMDRYCDDPAYETVSAKVAEAGNGRPDPTAEGSKAARRLGEPKADTTWIMTDADEWRLHASRVVNPNATVDECTVRMAGLETASMIGALLDDKGLVLHADKTSRTKRTLEFRDEKRDRMILYQVEPGPDDPMKSHDLIVMDGALSLLKAYGRS
ncbi:hypothetical protein [Caulobacter hibisci]|uniref:Lipoprotein n=1 Tax=Caulobacter hibisci TaxID=2035993 RepID=A0ABS0T1F9_9CAUL|nr:hypothetical protein [Caulobacter hibisci]MBI1685706.1 hypothetical protein [Caulobacter hibisci]